MPHFFSNRPRVHCLTEPLPDLEAHFRWETANAAIYALGGLVFIVGSVFFFPALSELRDFGAGIFFFGSLLYLLVTGHDLAEVAANAKSDNTRGRSRQKLDLAAARAYVAGTVLFAIGSAFFFSVIDWTVAGAWCFTIGSALFIFGAAVNLLDIVFARDMTTLQLLNLTAVTYIVGSVLFCVASIPYLWTLASAADRDLLNQYLAWLFVVGSALFLIGGAFNYWRAWLVAKAS